MRWRGTGRPGAHHYGHCGHDDDNGDHDDDNGGDIDITMHLYIIMIIMSNHNEQRGA